MLFFLSCYFLQSMGSNNNQIRNYLIFLRHSEILVSEFGGILQFYVHADC